MDSKLTENDALYPVKLYLYGNKFINDKINTFIPNEAINFILLNKYFDEVFP